MRNVPVNLLWFMFAITLNALGNSFMIAADLGSAPWTSAGQSLAAILPLSVGVCIILLNLISFVLSHLLKVKFTLAMIIKSLALTFVFGLFIDLFMYLHHILYVPEDLWIRGFYLIIGLNLVAITICIYFQSGTVYLPSDYLLKAFGKLMNNYTTGTILCTAIPISISLLILLFQNYAGGLGAGTILFMFGMGFLIDHYNRWIVIKEVPKQKTHAV
jgi:uncharacterized protein